MANGQMTLGTLTDEQFVRLIQIKDKTNGKLSFTANQSVIPTTIPGPTPKAGFNNVNLTFNDAEGLKAAAEVLLMLAG